MLDKINYFCAQYNALLQKSAENDQKYARQREKEVERHNARLDELYKQEMDIEYYQTNALIPKALDYSQGSSSLPSTGTRQIDLKLIQQLNAKSAFSQDAAYSLYIEVQKAKQVIDYFKRSENQLHQNTFNKIKRSYSADRSYYKTQREQLLSNLEQLLKGDEIKRLRQRNQNKKQIYLGETLYPTLLPFDIKDITVNCQVPTAYHMPLEGKCVLFRQHLPVYSYLSLFVHDGVCDHPDDLLIIDAKAMDESLREYERLKNIVFRFPDKESIKGVLMNVCSRQIKPKCILIKMDSLPYECKQYVEMLLYNIQFQQYCILIESRELNESLFDIVIDHDTLKNKKICSSFIYPKEAVPNHNLIESIIQVYTQMQEKKKRFYENVPLVSQLKKSKRVVLPLGLDDQGQLVLLELSKVVNSVVIGTTGCGKSTVLKYMISTLMQYDPSVMEVHLCDLKLMEFARYRNHPFPQLKTLLISEEESAICHFIDMMYEKMLQREKELARLGKKSYIHSHLPSCVILIDEFSVMSQVILSESRYANDYSAKFQQLLSKGRAVGMFTLLTSQYYTGGISGLSQPARNNIKAKMAMLNPKDEIIQMLDISYSRHRNLLENLKEYQIILQDEHGLKKVHTFNYTEQDEKIEFDYLQKINQKYPKPKVLILQNLDKKHWNPSLLPTVNQDEVFLSLGQSLIHKPLMLIKEKREHILLLGHLKKQKSIWNLLNACQKSCEAQNIGFEIWAPNPIPGINCITELDKMHQSVLSSSKNKIIVILECSKCFELQHVVHQKMDFLEKLTAIENGVPWQEVQTSKNDTVQLSTDLPTWMNDAVKKGVHFVIHENDLRDFPLDVQHFNYCIALKQRAGLYCNEFDFSCTKNLKDDEFVIIDGYENIVAKVFEE